MPSQIPTVLLLGLVSACSSSREDWNSVREARFHGEEGRLETAADHARLHLKQLEASLAQLQTEVEALNTRALVLRQTGDEQSEIVTTALARQKAMEQDLAAAKAREAEIKLALAPVRALEGQLATKTGRTKQLHAAMAAEDKKISDLQALLKARQTEVNTITGTLQKRSAELDKVIAELKAARKSSEPFFRPAPKAPAKKAPAKKPPAKK